MIYYEICRFIEISSQVATLANLCWGVTHCRSLAGGNKLVSYLPNSCRHAKVVPQQECGRTWCRHEAVRQQQRNARKLYIVTASRCIAAGQPAHGPPDRDQTVADDQRHQDLVPALGGQDQTEGGHNGREKRRHTPRREPNFRKVFLVLFEHDVRFAEGRTPAGPIQPHVQMRLDQPLAGRSVILGNHYDSIGGFAGALHAHVLVVVLLWEPVAVQCGRPREAKSL